MKKNNLILVVLFTMILCCFQDVFAQPVNTSPTPEVLRENREKSFAKLLEAQRLLWKTRRGGIPESAVLAGTKAAKEALQKAIELNPTLSEAYTTLAELSDIEEATMLSTIAVKINPDNFGGHKLLARIYTIRSKINSPILDPIYTEKAIVQWKEIVRLDPRNAEGWAFLSKFYERTDKVEENISALKKWMASSSPLETFFYRRLLGAQEDLSPESAGVKLGAALVKANRTREAIDILSQAVADDPENTLAIDLLRQAIQGGEVGTSQKTIEMLQQAVFANPGNLVLVEILADVQARLGNTQDAIKTIKNTISKLGESNNNYVANLQVTIGDFYFQSNQNDEAISAYEQALKSFGIEKASLTTDDQREFATRVFEKIIKTYKTAGKITEARAAIERARTLLGKSDLFADKQMLSLLRETKKNDEALLMIRSLRRAFADDYSLMRTEASILTEQGKVDDGVAIIKNLIVNKPAVPSPYYDDFSNYLFISGLYSQVKRNREAIISAQQALSLAQTEDRKQLASLSMATAQHQSGDYKIAEDTLRNILKRTPENPIALNNLGYFLLERNEKIPEAVEFIKKAVKIDSNNASYLDSLGWGFYKLGKFDDSEKFLKEALRLNPASSNSYEHLGDVYLKQGKFELARSAWQKALSFSSDNDVVSRIRAKIAKNTNN
ncbi:MAG TPA: tetratricopeptide repeat protein [Pyrinomonadaceae bacterium]|nr:tetratricopeptide repeat protein [Pyrinomonadaceae bacterium]